MIFAGFAPSYYLHGEAPLDIGTYLDRPPQPIRALFLLHGLAFSAWFLLQLARILADRGQEARVAQMARTGSDGPSRP